MNRIFARSQLGWAGSQSSQSLTRRPPAVVASSFAKLNVVVDWMRDEIYHQGGRRCRLAAREAGLLACQARKVGIPVSRVPILLQHRHLELRRTPTCTIDMHVSLLRRELDDDAEGTSVLITVYLAGYMRHRDAISSDDVPPALVAAGRVLWELITGLESLSTP